MNEDKGTILNAAVLKLNASSEDIQPRALVVEETTILELDEKTNFNNDDLLLLSDQEGNTNKIQLSNLIGGGVAQGNKKAVSGETVKATLDNYPTDSQVDNQINGALAYQTKTNANACIPTTEGKTEQFQVNNANDTPDKSPCIIVAKMEKQTSYYNLYQELISYDANSKVVKYIRYGYSTNKTNWTYGNWEKLVTENEERQNYNHVNTSYNSEYINTFNFKLVKKNGILIINIENLSFKKSGINVSNVITGLPPIKDRITIQISDWNGHTGMLRYENNGSILMIWNSNSTDEVSGNAVGLVA